MRVDRVFGVQVTLDEDTALRLVCLLGGVETYERGGLAKLYVSLSALFPGRTLSFSDLFDGHVVEKP